MSDTKTAKKLTGGIIVIIILILCLCATTFAIIFTSVSMNENLFRTGGIGININDGKPVIRENEYIFEPGMTVEKEFFIENEGTWDVYYKIYLGDISGGLEDVLEITIKDGDDVLCSGIAAELTRKNTAASDDPLKVGQRKDLKIYIHYPEDAGNNTQKSDIAFTLYAEATQTKNNPDRLFE